MEEKSLDEILMEQRFKQVQSIHNKLSEQQAYSYLDSLLKLDLVLVPVRFAEQFEIVLQSLEVKYGFGDNENHPDYIVFEL